MRCVYARPVWYLSHASISSTPSGNDVLPIEVVVHIKDVFLRGSEKDSTHVMMVNWRMWKQRDASMFNNAILRASPIVVPQKGLGCAGHLTSFIRMPKVLLCPGVPQILSGIPGPSPVHKTLLRTPDTTFTLDFCLRVAFEDTAGNERFLNAAPRASVPKRPIRRFYRKSFRVDDSRCS
jgi:hypothetical protein